MQKDDVQKLLFVINPISGGKEKRNWEITIRDYFKESPHTMEFYLLNGKNDKVSVQHHIERTRPHKVVAVGGDGTVKMVAELIMNKPIALGILPAGSANGMAKDLNLPLVIKDALDVIVYGHCKPLDAIFINGKEICIHLSDIGLNALLVKYFESSSKRGMWGYIKGVLKMLWNKKKIYADIKLDKDSVHRKAYMVVLANASKYGTGATINPNGRSDDGLFEVVIVRRLNFFEFIKSLMRHTTFDSEKVEVFSTTSLTLTTFHRHYFQVDGEYRGRTKKITAKILPGCLKIMAPALQ